MKKFVLLILALALLCVLCACGTAAEPEPTAVTDEIIATLAIESPLTIPQERLPALYGIEAADIAAYSCFTTLDGGVFPDEVVIVKATDSAAAGRVEECLNARLASLLAQTQNYDPESLAIAQQCRVQKNGNYIALFISPQHEAMEQIYAAAFE